ncbi:hypothetical protein ACHMW4_25120 [Mesorhizobium sp. UC22_110]|uniref:hypothetical protein n=1 Tax=Mesorhizobium sp. UC22_110 TaxID=3374552 RepID=UPI0037582BAB
MTSLFRPVYADAGYARFRFRRILDGLRRQLMCNYDRYLQRLDLAELDTWQLTRSRPDARGCKARMRRVVLAVVTTPSV